MTGLIEHFQHLGEYVFAWTWQASIVVVLGWTITRLDRRHRPLLRCRLWSMAFVAVLLLPWGPLALASLSWTKQVKQAITASMAKESEDRPLAAEDVASAAESLALSTAGRHSEAESIPVTPPTFDASTFLGIFGLLWISGVSISAFHKLGAYARLHRIVKRASRVSPDILTDPADWRLIGRYIPPVFVSSDVRSPMLCGWFFPVILLPEDLISWTTAAERALLIRHECVHYARRDHWMSAVEVVLRSLMFFHPLVRAACRSFDVERELACDERVMELGGSADTYAKAIIKVAEQTLLAAPSSGNIFFASAVQLDSRIDRLFCPRAFTRRWVLVLLPILLLVAPTIGLGLWHSSSERPEREGPAIVEAPVQVASISPIAIPETRRVAPAVSPSAIPAQRATESPESESLGVRTDELKMTQNATLTLLTLRIPYGRLTFLDESESRRAVARIEAQIFTLAGRVVGRVDENLEISVPLADYRADGVNIFQKQIALPPGLYRLSLAVTDLGDGTRQIVERRLAVRQFPEGLSTSSLILADFVQPIPFGSDTMPFRIDSLAVRPNVKSEYTREQDLNAFLQIYGLNTDPVTGRAAVATIETSVLREGNQVQRFTENLQGAGNMTYSKTLSLSGLESGDYAIQVKVTDADSGETTMAEGKFTVR